MKHSRDARAQRDKANRPDEQPTNAGAEEQEIDRILADSFPASDPPPWTLGVTQAPAKDSRSPRKKGGRR
jgi:hypothetical protein